VLNSAGCKGGGSRGSSLMKGPAVDISTGGGCSSTGAGMGTAWDTSVVGGRVEATAASEAAELLGNDDSVAPLAAAMPFKAIAS
jgi:hypothetical protein